MNLAEQWKLLRIVQQLNEKGEKATYGRLCELANSNNTSVSANMRPMAVRGWLSKPGNSHTPYEITELGKAMLRVESADSEFASRLARYHGVLGSGGDDCVVTISASISAPGLAVLAELAEFIEIISWHSDEQRIRHTVHGSSVIFRHLGSVSPDVWQDLNPC